MIGLPPNNQTPAAAAARSAYLPPPQQGPPPHGRSVSPDNRGRGYPQGPRSLTTT
jgi:hypothetical protein